MSDNAEANAGSGGPNFRLLETAAGVKWPACVSSYAVTVSPGANVLQEVTAATPLPVTDVGVGGVADAAATAGSTGSVSAKLRLLTSQIATLLTQTDGLEGSVDGLETLLAGGLPAALSGGGGVKVGITDAASDPFGANADAAVAAGAAGSIQAKLRRLSADLGTLLTPQPASIGQKAKAAAFPVTLASDEDLLATAGATADAVVAAGAAGSLSAKLRRVTQGLEDLKTLIVLGAGENHAAQVGGHILTPSANFTRPNDTTAYALGDLVANNTAAGSVTPLSWTAARVASGSFTVRRVRLKKSGTGVTNASFRVHLYAASPTVTNGDNGAWLSAESSYLGAFDVTVDKVFSDAANGNGVPLIGSEISCVLGSGQTIYGLVESRGAYSPAAQEVFTATLELFPN